MSNARKTQKSPTGRPKLLGKGQYAIYEAPNGDGVVSYRPDGQEEDEHQVVPARFWSLLMNVINGKVDSISPVDIMKVLTGK